MHTHVVMQGSSDVTIHAATVCRRRRRGAVCVIGMTSVYLQSSIPHVGIVLLLGILLLAADEVSGDVRSCTHRPWPRRNITNLVGSEHLLTIVVMVMTMTVTADDTDELREGRHGQKLKKDKKGKNKRKKKDKNNNDKSQRKTRK